jgi:hypothetical protein
MGTLHVNEKLELKYVNKTMNNRSVTVVCELNLEL